MNSLKTNNCHAPLTITRKDYNINLYKAKKSVVLSTINIFGQKNTALVVTYIVGGVICLLLDIFLIKQYKKYKNQ